MSILADLLAKEEGGAPEASKGIPPTLSRAYDRSGEARKSGKTKYYAIAALSLVTVVLGFGMTFLYGRLERDNSEKLALNTRAVTQLAPAPPQAPPPPIATVTPSPAPIATAAAQGTARPAPEAATRPETKDKALPLAELHPAQHVGRQGDRPRTGSVPRPQHLGGAAHVAPQRQPAMQHIVPQSGAVARQASTVAVRPDTGTPSKTDTAAIGALLYAARSAEQAGDWRSALASYQRALETDPGNYKIRSNAAAALNNLGMFKEGAQQATKALDRKPNYVPALINAAIAYSSDGNTKEALRLFSAACAADPGNASLAVNLGILQERSGKLDDALATYGKLAASGEPHALDGMGRIYERRGNKSEAIDAYRRILTSRDLSPKFKKEVKDRLTRLED